MESLTDADRWLMLELVRLLALEPVNRTHIGINSQSAHLECKIGLLPHQFTCKLQFIYTVYVNLLTYSVKFVHYHIPQYVIFYTHASCHTKELQL